MVLEDVKLAVFDLDGTLKQARDPYVYLHQRLGTLEASRPITEKGMSGQLAYEEWLRQDVSLWKGVPRRVLEDLFRQNPYLPGAREVVRLLQDAGVTVAIISSGLLLHAELVAEELNIPIAIGNEIFFEPNGGEWVVSGQVKAHCPYNGKGEVLAALQAELGVPPEETLTVGDSRGDIPMFQRARWSVAVQPSHPTVAQAATWVIPHATLHPLREWLGVTIDDLGVTIDD
ncbi:MAG: HAD-IB family phosphatase [Chloroflexi bacterium]|nr:HAD-IB family phosphatase [Chloroflexota bacterium]